MLITVSTFVPKFNCSTVLYYTRTSLLFGLHGHISSTQCAPTGYPNKTSKVLSSPGTQCSFRSSQRWKRKQLVGNPGFLYPDQDSDQGCSSTPTILYLYAKFQLQIYNVLYFLRYDHCWMLLATIQVENRMCKYAKSKNIACYCLFHYCLFSLNLRFYIYQ